MYYKTKRSRKCVYSYNNMSQELRKRFVLCSVLLWFNTDKFYRYLPGSLRWQLYDCLKACEVTLQNMGIWAIWMVSEIHWLHISRHKPGGLYPNMGVLACQISDNMMCNSLFRLTAKKTPKFQTTVHLWENPTVTGMESVSIHWHYHHNTVLDIVVERSRIRFVRR